ncbi:unnamed protein product [Arabis nemorensis]|uniref:DUF4283 domain-containing protein n=1 Tax=Arabis nemorensis TaxID=586526 RepID=A0A565BNW2_9BRAS|nr:unnamed protein product [Arabis nemorensis]
MIRQFSRLRSWFPAGNQAQVPRHITGAAFPRHLYGAASPLLVEFGPKSSVWFGSGGRNLLPHNHKSLHRYCFISYKLTNLHQAFFGKLIAPEHERKRSKPLQLPPVDQEMIRKKFDKTLVGRVLNLEVQESRVKALIGCLPTVWKCEGRVQGIEMGRGKFHFRQHCDDRTVKRIREDLGELLEWRVVEPYPLLRVMVECDAPLILHRETVSDTGELFQICFDYMKIQNYWKCCYRLTHETRVCPERLGAQMHHRQPYQRRETEDERRRWRGARAEEAVRPGINREPINTVVKHNPKDMAYTSK